MGRLFDRLVRKLAGPDLQTRCSGVDDLVGAYPDEACVSRVAELGTFATSYKPDEHSLLATRFCVRSSLPDLLYVTRTSYRLCIGPHAG
jgi:hypothetical protein